MAFPPISPHYWLFFYFFLEETYLTVEKEARKPSSQRCPDWRGFSLGGLCFLASSVRVQFSLAQLKCYSQHCGWVILRPASPGCPPPWVPLWSSPSECPCSFPLQTGEWRTKTPEFLNSEPNPVSNHRESYEPWVREQFRRQRRGTLEHSLKNFYFNRSGFQKRKEPEAQRNQGTCPRPHKWQQNQTCCYRSRTRFLDQSLPVTPTHSFLSAMMLPGLTEDTTNICPCFIMYSISVNQLRASIFILWFSPSILKALINVFSFSSRAPKLIKDK